MERTNLLEAVVRAAKISGNMAIEKRGELHTEKKADGSLVTAVDKAIESYLRQELCRILPGSTVWGEEEGYEAPGVAGLWLVDPIDGTTNYVYGSPLWGVSIGLLIENELVLGAIYLPDLQSMYSGGPGLGAYKNGKALTPIQPGVIESFDPVSLPDRALIEFGDSIPGKMRYLGAWVAEAAWFFEGWVRGVVNQKGSLYDIAGSIPIAIELGADVRYSDGSAINYNEILGMDRLPKPALVFPRNSGCFF